MVELHIDHLVDNHNSALNPIDRLLALQSRRNAWNDPSHIQARMLTVERGDQLQASLQHGVLTRLLLQRTPRLKSLTQQHVQTIEPSEWEAEANGPAWLMNGRRQVFS